MMAMVFRILFILAIIYLIAKRMEDKKNENFEERDN
jgi:flagellar biogenesis protein FliO